MYKVSLVDFYPWVNTVRVSSTMQLQENKYTVQI